MPRNRAPYAVGVAKSGAFIEHRIDLTCLAPHRGEMALTEDPKIETEHLDQLLERLGLSDKEDKEEERDRYAGLTDADRELLRYVVGRCRSGF